MNRHQFKNILCIRADNMGDVLMSSPALHALKESFDCRLTLLTSRMGSLITPFIKEIDETLVFDLPWVKTSGCITSTECLTLIEKLKTYSFDAAIIFTVYSQSSLPSAMLTYMAGIPVRVAYSRENPYELLTHWLPDKEPYSFIQHQVKRDIQLVRTIGAVTSDEHLSINYNDDAFTSAIQKLTAIGFDPNKKYIVAHAGVSELKREYPKDLWRTAINLIQEQTNVQVLLTGTQNEAALTEYIRQGSGENIFSVAGILNTEEFISAIAHAALVISVNTATVHIAAALKVPVVVLYALTNPQHTPWLTENIVLPYSVPNNLRSKNEIIQFVNQTYYYTQVDFPSPVTIAESANILMKEKPVQFV
jgi:ADP-heptose:LPS heptosyltransferase